MRRILARRRALPVAGGNLLAILHDASGRLVALGRIADQTLREVV